jgi:hypothetical protein
MKWTLNRWPGSKQVFCLVCGVPRSKVRTCSLELQPKRFAEHWPPALIIHRWKPSCHHRKPGREASGRAVTAPYHKKTPERIGSNVGLTGTPEKTCLLTALVYYWLHCSG